jgi:hypothetical protein
MDQFLPAAELADSPKNELFGVVTRLKPSPVKLSYSLYYHL